MTRPIVHVCSFSTSAVDNLRGSALTYDALKLAVIAAGRFSCFEATETRRKAKLFTALCADPEIQTFDLGFPWTGVRRRQQPDEPAPQRARSAIERVLLGGEIPVERQVRRKLPDWPGDETEKIVHFCWHVNQHGGVAALCAPRRVVRLSSRESWTLRWGSVSCDACRQRAFRILHRSEAR